MSRRLSGMFVAWIVVGAVSFVGTTVPASARQDRGQKQDDKKGPGDKRGPDDNKGADNKKGPEERKGPPAPQPEHAPHQAPPQKAAPEKAGPPPQHASQHQPAAQKALPQHQAPQHEASAGRAAPQHQAPPQAPRQQAAPPHQQAQAPQRGPAPQRLPPQQQKVLIGQQQQRLVQYGAQLEQQQRVGVQQATALQAQHRTAQYSFQLQYTSHLREQELGIQKARTYNYDADPYFYTPPSYQYSRGGRSYLINNYGANVLRQAVNDGYDEGLAAGRADRQDRWKYDYQTLYAYQDANYGYTGFYVERAEYNYYFRQGFQRGYEDGYYERYRYGVQTGGRYVVQAPVLSVIISFRSIR